MVCLSLGRVVRSTNSTDQDLIAMATHSFCMQLTQNRITEYQSGSNNPALGKDHVFQSVTDINGKRKKSNGPNRSRTFFFLFFSQYQHKTVRRIVLTCKLGNPKLSK